VKRVNKQTTGFELSTTTTDNNEDNEKKRSERRKHCAPAVVRRSQKFKPRRRPPCRGRGTAKI